MNEFVIISVYIACQRSWYSCYYKLEIILVGSMGVCRQDNADTPALVSEAE